MYQNGCLVVNAPTANTIAAAEHGIAMLCTVSRNIAQADASMKNGKWDRGTFVGTGVTGKTMAVMGFGKVSFLSGLVAQLHVELPVMTRTVVSESIGDDFCVYLRHL